MAYGIDITLRAWSDLRRREDELKWNGNLGGFGQQYDSLGRPTDALERYNAAWTREQMGRVDRVQEALHRPVGDLAHAHFGGARTLLFSTVDR